MNTKNKNAKFFKFKKRLIFSLILLGLIILIGLNMSTILSWNWHDVVYLPI